jgi:DNA-binding transcriptional regulator YdaS (Cro superfamily)
MSRTLAAERPEILEEVFSGAGGLRNLARQLGLTPGTVSVWRRVPAEHCLEVERLSGVSRYRLRPDVYGSARAERARA